MTQCNKYNYAIVTWIVVEAVVDVWGSMEEVSNTVTYEARHHRAVVTLGVLMNCLAQA